jgi:hypothetical protein
MVEREVSTGLLASLLELATMSRLGGGEGSDGSPCVALSERLLP